MVSATTKKLVHKGNGRRFYLPLFSETKKIKKNCFTLLNLSSLNKILNLHILLTKVYFKNTV